jgi:hypothetical protein
MAEDFEDEPKRKKRKKTFFTRKRVLWILGILLLLSIGAAVEHFVIEPAINEGYAKLYSECLSEKKVLDERYAECEKLRQACEYQLGLCTGTG